MLSPGSFSPPSLFLSLSLSLSLPLFLSRSRSRVPGSSCRRSSRLGLRCPRGSSLFHARPMRIFVSFLPARYHHHPFRDHARCAGYRTSRPHRPPPRARARAARAGRGRAHVRACRRSSARSCPSHRQTRCRSPSRAARAWARALWRRRKTDRKGCYTARRRTARRACRAGVTSRCSPDKRSRT
ncbi:hypothetical protein BC834DRAFT_194573 [Gloeopeniophorella convolvens]|nr:hypothetical protein BC834DRAFT_194573 [Gloeopeniophorella convolvens]